MKKYILLLLFLVNLQIEWTSDGLDSSSFAKVFAQHQTLEVSACSGDCDDWGISSYPCKWMASCHQQFDNAHDRDAHQLVCEYNPDPDYICEKCNANLGKSYAKYANHLRTCLVCDKCHASGFNSVDAYNDHIDRCGIENESCYKCGRTNFSTYTELHSHLESCNGNKSDNHDGSEDGNSANTYSGGGKGGGSQGKDYFILPEVVVTGFVNRNIYAQQLWSMSCVPTALANSIYTLESSTISSPETALSVAESWMTRYDSRYGANVRDRGVANIKEFLTISGFACQEVEIGKVSYFLEHGLKVLGVIVIISGSEIGYHCVSIIGVDKQNGKEIAYTVIDPDRDMGEQIVTYSIDRFCEIYLAKDK